MKKITISWNFNVYVIGALKTDELVYAFYSTILVKDVYSNMLWI